MKKTDDKTQEGIYYYTLENKNGMSVTLTNYGATLMSVITPDKNGNFDEVTLGYDDVQGYKQGKCFFGATVGRYANRIAGGRFALGDEQYTLARNDGNNHLHGGIVGFDKVIWDEAAYSNDSVTFSYFSPNGDEGYPGNLNVTVQFSLDDVGELKIHYTATSDKDTVVNLTNHAYFNLAGHKSGVINEHLMMINAERYTPLDNGGTASGEIAPIKNTPFDFSEFTAIGDRMNDENEQLKFGSGYDHNYIINGSGYRLAAKAFEKSSGRLMSVYTDKPCMQLYCGNFLDAESGKDGATYNIHDAFCLETQFAPDAPNQESFASAVLRAGDTYDYTTAYRFEVKDDIEG
ncbi:MAG: galactose mutarotase [Clostridia bacterium]|jgi:aldose 1-epimerase|nr:galactose mutarotase [Clostridia bacterium]MBT7122888.1 galactose mutarotase [Clostridia bacterium]